MHPMTRRSGWTARNFVECEGRREIGACGNTQGHTRTRGGGFRLFYMRAEGPSVAEMTGASRSAVCASASRTKPNTAGPKTAANLPDNPKKPKNSPFL
jgi:hypothetical protein